MPFDPPTAPGPTKPQVVAAIRKAQPMGPVAATETVLLQEAWLGEHQELVAAAHRHFGSWQKAILASGVQIRW